MGDLYQSQFFRNNRLDLSGQSLFFRTLLPLAAFVATLLVTREVITSLVVLLVCNLVCTYGLAIRRVKSFVEKRTPFDPAALKRLTGQAVPLFISDFLAGFILGVPRFGIDRLLDETAQGYYALIFMPVFTINLLSLLLFKPALGRCARLLEDRDFDTFRKLITRQVGIIVVLTLLALVAVQLVGIPVLSWIYGIDLTPVKLDLVVITLGGGFVALCNIGYFLLVIMRRQKSVLIAYSLGLVIAVVLCGILIFVAGLTGACWGFVLSYIALFMLFLLFTGNALRQLTHPVRCD
jgi:O-antigen/teichoic acid export membrane protein